MGEKEVASILNRLPDEYTIFNDVYLNEDGRDNQIDHVVLSPYGIFVIETKRYSGWIYGGENAQYWTKNMFGQKYQFYNPIRQNLAHVIALKKLFGLPQTCFFPIVVFTGSAELKSDFPHYSVIYAEELLSEIRSHNNVIIGENVLTMAINKLSYSSFTTRETEKEHLKAVKTTISESRNAIRQGICPKCGGKLVYRKGKYGDFWGCSNVSHRSTPPCIQSK